MKIYDLDKAKEIITRHSDNLKEASIGMYEDWFWTAETIWKDGEYTQEIEQGMEIGGIKGSKWATPALWLEFKDGTEKMLPVYKGESDSSSPGFPMLGVLSAPVQTNLPKLEEDK